MALKGDIDRRGFRIKGTFSFAIIGVELRGAAPYELAQFRCGFHSELVHPSHRCVDLASS